jgi:hypothetical protein
MARSPLRVHQPTLPVVEPWSALLPEADIADMTWHVSHNRKTPQGRRVRFRVALAFALRSDVASIFTAEGTEAKHAQQDLRDG